MKYSTSLKNYEHSFRINCSQPELALGWNFLGIPDPKSQFRALGMGIFHFGLDKKMGIGDLEPPKIAREKSSKYLESRVWGFEIFGAENPKAKSSKYL